MNVLRNVVRTRSVRSVANLFIRHGTAPLTHKRTPRVDFSRGSFVSPCYAQSCAASSAPAPHTDTHSRPGNGSPSTTHTVPTTPAAT